MFKTLFVINKGLVSGQLHPTHMTAIWESVGEMFGLNVVPEISGHVGTVLIAQPTGPPTQLCHRYELIKIFQALELTLKQCIVKDETSHR